MAPLIISSIYSLYLGSYNEISIQSKELSLTELYSRLFKGISYQFINRYGFYLIFIVLIINLSLLLKNKSIPHIKKTLYYFKWIALFSVIYLLLLPLGGYRSYRPYILRYDTVLPITLGLFFLYGFSSWIIIKHVPLKIIKKGMYIIMLLLIAGYFTIVDKLELSNNQCEKQALEQLSTSTSSSVELDYPCKVLSWEVISNKNDSKLNSELLTIWRITDKETLYYYQETK